MKLGKKLTLSFLSVAAITLIVGGMGYYGLVKSANGIETIGNVSLPSVACLEKIIVDAEKARGSLRSLGIPSLPKETRMRQYSNFFDAREGIIKEIKNYETLPHSADEMKIWESFKSDLNGWKVENDKYIAMCKKIDTNGISNPQELVSQLEKFSKDHYILAQKILNLLYVKNVAFDGGDNHTACNFGKWMPNFKTDNQELANQIEAFKEPHHHFHEAVGKIKQLAQAGKIQEAKAVYEKDMLPAMQEVFAHFDKMLAVANDSLHIMTAAEQQLFGPVTENQRAVIDALEKLAKLNSKNAEDEVSNVESQAKILRIFSLIAMFTGVGLATILGLIISGLITRPVIKAVNLATAMANGDLTQRLDIKTKDEIGDLANAINRSSDSLSDLISEIQSNAETLSSSSEEFSAVASQLAAGAEEMTAQAQTVASAADQMSENINSMASSSDEMSSNSNNVSSAAEQISNFMTTVAAAVEESLTNLTSVATASEEMSSTVGEIAKNTEKSREVTQNAVSAVSKTSEQIQTLSTASQEISKVIETIVEIAEQTKLLALNATIEAARAGEAGKGFAVVASEVKELAKQTNSATDDIRKRIGAMQSSTEATVSDIKTIQNAINDVNEIVNTIAAAVEEQNVTVQENVRNITQATDGVKEVAKSVTEVNKGVEDIAKNISEVAVGANNVSQQSTNAASGVKDVNENIKGVTQAASDTSQAAQQVNISAEDLAKMAMGLQESAGKFKVATDEERHAPMHERKAVEHHEEPKVKALKKPERKELPGGLHKK